LTTPELFPRFAAFENPNRGKRAASRSFDALQEVMLDEAGETEKAALLRVTDRALEGRFVRIGPQIVLVNANYPGHFRFPYSSVLKLTHYFFAALSADRQVVFSRGLRREIRRGLSKWLDQIGNAVSREAAGTGVGVLLVHPCKP
jgi:hypothetical protein